MVVVEFPYVRDLIDFIEFDTIYHEHLCYFSVGSAQALFARHGLHLNDVRRLPIHGGSLRLYFGKTAAPSEAVAKILAEEKALGLDTYAYYESFGARVRDFRAKARELVGSLKAEGKRIAAYGAAAKGTIMLNFLDLNSRVIEYAVDRNTHKQGKYMPGVRVPIDAPEKLATDKPDYVVILPWNFRDEIIRQQQDFLKSGGKFVVPIPGPGNRLRMNEASVCPACGGEQLTEIYRLDSIPVQSCVLLDSRDEALAFPRHGLLLKFCDDCGFVFNATFDLDLVDYASTTEESQHFSGTFNRFAKELVAEIASRYDLKGKRTLEIGCGKGDFLQELARQTGTIGIGVDPGFIPERLPGANGHEIVFQREYFDPERIEVPPDFVVCRHTLEHIPEVGRFMHDIAEVIDGRSDVGIFFETPDVRRVLAEGAFWDIYFEHCSYFTLGSHARLFRRAGLDVTRLYLAYDDQYIIQYAEPGHGTAAAAAGGRPRRGARAGRGVPREGGRGSRALDRIRAQPPRRRQARGDLGRRLEGRVVPDDQRAERRGRSSRRHQSLQAGQVPARHRAPGDRT